MKREGDIEREYAREREREIKYTISNLLYLARFFMLVIKSLICSR